MGVGKEGDKRGQMAQAFGRSCDQRSVVATPNVHIKVPLHTRRDRGVLVGVRVRDVALPFADSRESVVARFHVRIQVGRFLPTWQAANLCVCVGRDRGGELGMPLTVVGGRLRKNRVCETFAGAVDLMLTRSYSQKSRRSRSRPGPCLAP